MIILCSSASLYVLHVLMSSFDFGDPTQTETNPRTFPLAERTEPETRELFGSTKKYFLHIFHIVGKKITFNK